MLVLMLSDELLKLPGAVSAEGCSCQHPLCRFVHPSFLIQQFLYELLLLVTNDYFKLSGVILLSLVSVKGSVPVRALENKAGKRQAVEDAGVCLLFLGPYP